jgi:type IV pilus assembly protein PilB
VNPLRPIVTEPGQTPLRRRVQAYIQVHSHEQVTAAILAARLEVPREEIDAVLAALTADGSIVRRDRDSGEAAYAPSIRQKRLGEMLVESELITAAQLEEALAEQAKTGERLGNILMSRGFISKQVLGEALEAQRGTPYVNLATYSIDEPLMRELSPALIAELKVVPFERVGREIHVAMLDPTDVVAIDRVSALLRGRVRPFLTTERDFAWVLSTYFDVSTAVQESIESGAGDEDAPEFAAVTASDSPDDPPVVRLTDSLVQGAVRDGATDLHIEPQVADTAVRYRIDGLLYDKARLPRGVGAAVVSRVKALAGVDIAERVRPQDGRLLYHVNGREHDLRISTVGTSFGERVTIRLLDKSRVLLGFERLGLLPEQEALLNRLLTRSYGMILVTGPTGSGKTTTLYSCISRINERTRNIMTIEDPVEYHLEGITQIAVRSKMAFSFATGLRAILRHDPDVVMVGEVRDSETAHIAIQAALTGHLVLSTLHTNDAAGAIVRLVEMGVEPYLITSTLLASVGQRLIRRLCPTCRRPYQAPTDVAHELGLTGDPPVTLYAPHGCTECAELGYRGRTGVYEVMSITDKIRELILQRKPASTMREAAMRGGMISIRGAGTAKALDGITSIEELRRVIFTEVD